MTCSGWPVNRLRRTGSCVAMPTGQVLRWHLRIMMQPAAISGAVAKPNSSAPSSAPMATSRPVRSPPSTCTAMRPRKPFSTSVCWVSARPISHAEAARRDLLDGRAHGIAVGQRLEAVGLLAALAGVRLAADPVHGDGERRVGLAADRAEAHGAGGEAPDDAGGGLDLLDRNRLV